MIFQAGDRVRCVVDGGGDSVYDYPKASQEGTVVYYCSEQFLPYGIKFDEEFPGGHDLWGMIPSHRGWFCSADALELICQKEDLSVESLDWEEVL